MLDWSNKAHSAKRNKRMGLCINVCHFRAFYFAFFYKPAVTDEGPRASEKKESFFLFFCLSGAMVTCKFQCMMALVCHIMAWQMHLKSSKPRLLLSLLSHFSQFSPKVQMVAKMSALNQAWTNAASESANLVSLCFDFFDLGTADFSTQIRLRFVQKLIKVDCFPLLKTSIW